MIPYDKAVKQDRRHFCQVGPKAIDRMGGMNIVAQRPDTGDVFTWREFKVKLRSMDYSWGK